VKHIVIISASVRTGAKSPRVARYFKQHIEARELATTEVLDLAQYQFPVFTERLKYQENPLPAALEFAEKVRKADAVLIVTPEYNGGYPASLKNVTDLLIEEWKHKPVAISMVSSGAFAGTQVITSLLFTLWKIGATMVPAMFPVPAIDKTFDEEGVPADAEATDKRADAFLKELLWYTEKLGA
jgi:NAD(P)H-dependent FMN reductase